MTGLSGAGKSTLAMALQRALFQRGIDVYTLDGDNIRNGLNRDLGFGERERVENLRRVAEVAKILADAGVIVISAFIAPTAAVRKSAREIIGSGFHEVFIDADLSVCEGRDTKGLYAKARRGEIPDFTGINSPWEAPLRPELIIHSGNQTLDESLNALVQYVDKHVLNSGAKIN
jgi:bifunctional enzyme CysN/CysC